MVEVPVESHAEALHHGLRREVEDGGHGPDHGQSDPVEADVEGCPPSLSRVALVPSTPGESPADLLIADAGHALGHGVEAGETDELTGVHDLECPEAEEQVATTACRC